MQLTSMPALALPASDTTPTQQQYGQETGDDVAIQDEFEHVSVDLTLLSRGLTMRDDILLHVKSDQEAVHLNPPVSLAPAQFKFLSCSLPNSAYSSPRFSTGAVKKKVYDSSVSSLQGGVHMNRSKSCGEGRASAPPDDFDIWQHKPNAPVEPEKGNDSSRCSKTGDGKREKRGNCGEQFKCGCGALCLFLAGFGKEKGKGEREIEKAMSRRVSLEKFECGSWASSAMVHEEGELTTSLYFDLPIELIRKSVGSQTPVKAAFVFERKVKGKGKKSDAEISPATTPRFHKAKEDFNAFLEAQGA